jgi:hypothetical protein
MNERWNAIWEHLRWVYERTDRAFTTAAAAWYEANEPLALAGLAAKVGQAIDRKEAAA